MARTILNIHAQQKCFVHYSFGLRLDENDDTGYQKNTSKSQQSLT